MFIDKKIQFFVVDLSGKAYLFNLPLSTTIKELKERIKDKTGIKIEAQRILTGSKPTDDHKTLEFYSIKDNSIIYLVMRLQGGE